MRSGFVTKFILVEYADRNLKHIQFDRLKDAQALMVKRFNEILDEHPKYDEDLTYVDERDARVLAGNELFLWDIIVVQ